MSHIREALTRLSDELRRERQLLMERTTAHAHNMGDEHMGDVVSGTADAAADAAAADVEDEDNGGSSSSWETPGDGRRTKRKRSNST